MTLHRPRRNLLTSLVLFILTSLTKEMTQRVDANDAKLRQNVYMQTTKQILFVTNFYSRVLCMPSLHHILSFHSMMFTFACLLAFCLFTLSYGLGYASSLL